MMYQLKAITGQVEDLLRRAVEEADVLNDIVGETALGLRQRSNDMMINK